MQHINNFSGGMKRGIDHSIMPQDSYTYMLNGYLVSRDNHGYVVTAIKGNKAIAQFDVDECPIGSVTFNGILYIITHKIVSENGFIHFYSLDGTLGNGWVKDTMKIIPNGPDDELIISDTVLGLTRDKLIEVFAKQSYDGSVDLYICNGLTPNVVVNTGINQLGYNTERKYIDLTDAAIFQLQKSTSVIPTVTHEIINTGNLKPGSYFFYVRYEDESLNPTPFIKEYGPVIIHSGISSNNSSVAIANESNAKLSKSIKLVITNTDSRYKKLSVGVVFYYGSSGTVSRENYLIDKSYTINNNSCTIVLTGYNGIRSLLIEEIVTDNLQYNVSESHLQFDNRYFGANWKGQELDYTILKEFAKRIIPHAVLKSENNFDKVYDSSNNELEYMENEIYPLGVSFLIDGRYKTPVFPICSWHEGIEYENELLTYNGRITKTNQSRNANIKQNIDLTQEETYCVAYTRDEINVNVPVVIQIEFQYEDDGEMYLSDEVGIIPVGSNSVLISFSESNVQTATIKNISTNNDAIDTYWEYTKYNYGTATSSVIQTNRNIDFIQSVTSPSLKTKLDNLASLSLRTNYINSLNTANGNNGLYLFPNKVKIAPNDTNVGNVITSGITSDLHFKLMGLKFDYKYAYEYLASLVNNIPNITGFYMVQGDRQKNIITQGFSVAAVESVGFHTKLIKSDNSNIFFSESMNLGRSNDLVAFPLIDGTDYRLFPVMKISKAYDGSGGEYTDWRYVINEDDITKMYVLSQDEIITNLSQGVYLKENSVPDLSHHYIDFMYPANIDADDLIKLKNVNTNKFCIFTPDILMDSNIVIPENIYIKPIKKILNPRGSDLSFKHVGSGPDVYSNIYTRAKYDQLSTRKFKTYDTFLKYHDFANDKYTDKWSSRSVYAGSSTVVSYKEINLNGFSSKMKSLYEIFGYDLKRDDEPQSPILTNYFSSSRYDLFKAGILLNRTKCSTNDLDVTPAYIQSHAYFGYSEDTKKWAKYAPFACPLAPQNFPQLSLPLVFTNLSMESLPYIGITLNGKGSYSTEAQYNVLSTEISDSGLSETVQFNNTLSLQDYRDMHNTIVNVCAYRNIEEYITAIEGLFNIESESFAIIEYQKNNSLVLTSTSLFKGDIFSQKTSMRTMRWTNLPESTVDNVSRLNWEAAWKQATGINVYLQSRVNTHLRLSDIDSDYLPHVLNNSLVGSINDKIDDFIWKNSYVRNTRESWSTNEGYHQLKGLLRLSAFDDLYLKKEFKSLNRIYYSNKHVDGSFVDAYREIPVGQYQDFNFENGEILKLIKTNNYLFSIQRGSINQHFSSSKLVQSEDSSSIITGDKNILSEEYRQLAEIGTQHKESVINGELGIYGIDWNKERIWRIKGVATQSGATAFGVETLEVSKSISDIFKWLKTVLNGSLLPQDLMGEVATGIHSVYDEKNKQILFTFKLGLCLVNEATTVDGVPVPAMYDELSYTLAFSEEFDTFIGFYSFNKNIYLKFDNRLLSFTKGDKNLWEHNIGDYQSIDGVICPFVLEVIINGLSKEQNVGNYEKEFLSHIMNSSPEDINSISWETEYQESEKNPFIDAAEFWSNPEYREHNWYIPIIENTNSNKGPKSNEEFNTFEPSSKMRGQWLKFKVTYIPEEGISQEHQFYVRNLITNLIISFT